ncbi:hypothetical protein C8R48DRAFT_589973, partial [Suillus tomentosus]
ADVYEFFYHVIIHPEGTLSLEELHSIISNVWLTRHDDELEQERAARRKGRQKSTKELKLDEIKLRISEQYRTGMCVPDLTHEATVKLFRKWDQTEVAYIQLLRFIPINSVDPMSDLQSYSPSKNQFLRKPLMKPWSLIVMTRSSLNRHHGSQVR